MDEIARIIAMNSKELTKDSCRFKSRQSVSDTLVPTMWGGSMAAAVRCAFVLPIADSCEDASWVAVPTRARRKSHQRGLHAPKIDVISSPGNQCRHGVTLNLPAFWMTYAPCQQADLLGYPMYLDCGCDPWRKSRCALPVRRARPSDRAS